MRWKQAESTLYQSRPWFAWHPVLIDDEWVWLETVLRTHVGWYNDFDGSRTAYEYAHLPRVTR
jgi:hypothetical protein